MQPIIRFANKILAKKPRFVVIGTPRTATTYFAELCRANGVVVSHEEYFTEYGPMLRNPNRRFDTVGDVSWLAPPFLPDDGMIAIHQVRNPLKVIRSIFNMGLFDPSREHTRKPFVAMAKTFFRFSQDPLHSAMRFYIEWNQRCEDITDKRFRIEDLDSSRDKIAEWLNIDLGDMVQVSKTTNRRSPEVAKAFRPERLKTFPEYRTLQDMAERYGYRIDIGN